MKKFIITGLFTSLISFASLAMAEDTKEKSIEPIQVVCPPATTDEEAAQPVTDSTAESNTQENK